MRLRSGPGPRSIRGHYGRPVRMRSNRRMSAPSQAGSGADAALLTALRDRANMVFRVRLCGGLRFGRGGAKAERPAYKAVKVDSPVDTVIDSR